MKINKKKIKKLLIIAGCTVAFGGLCYFIGKTKSEMDICKLVNTGEDIFLEFNNFGKRTVVYMRVES